MLQLRSDNILAALVAAFMLVGRWSPFRTDQYADILSQSAPLTEFRTWIAAAILLFGTAYFRSIQQGGNISPSLVGMVTFLVIALLSGFLATDHPNEIYLHRKIFDIIILLIVLPIISAYSLRREFVELFWGWIIVLGSILMVLGLAALVAGNTTFGGYRLAVLGGGPNVYGRIMVLTAIAIGYQLISARRWLAFRSALLATALALSVAAGSRGVLLALMGTATVAVLSHWKQLLRLRAVKYILAFTLVSLIPLILIGRELFPIIEYRYLFLTFDEGYTSGRDMIFRLAIDQFLANPVFGAGLAGFSYVSYLNYPHNLILEILTGFGVFGLFILLVPILVDFAWRGGWRCFRYAPRETLALSFIFFASMFSGDLYDSRGVFVFILMAVQSTHRAFAVTKEAGADYRTSVPTLRSRDITR